MTALIYSYTDYQAKMVPRIAAALTAENQDCLHIGRRTKLVSSPMVRSLGGFATFDSKGDTLPLLSNPLEFEDQFLNDYIDQMTRYSKGLANRHHALGRHYEYRDHFHLTARKILAYLRQNNVTTVLFFNVPHMGDDYLFYRMAEMLNIPVVMLVNSLFRNRFFSASRLEKIGLISGEIDKAGDVGAFEKLNKELRESVKVYMGGSYKALDAGLNLRQAIAPMAIILARCPRLLRSPKKLKLALSEIRRIKSSLGKFRRTKNEVGRDLKAETFLMWLSGLERNIAGLPEDFVYVAMHYQPEMTSSPLGGRYVDQAVLIEQLAAKLPAGMKIVAKENPLQASIHRSPDFIRRVSRCENVMMVHPSMDTAYLLQKSKLVATITGTAGWEAIKAEKPCLSFGYSWYRDCAGITQFGPDTDIETAIANAPSQITTEKFVSRLMARSHSGVIYEAFLKDTSPEFALQNEENITRSFVNLMMGRTSPTFA